MKIDIFTHIVPPKYKAALGKVAPHLERHMERMPTLYDMDRRFRILDRYEEVRQVLTLNKTASAVFDDSKLAVDFAQRANDEMAELVDKNPDRFAAGVAALPVTDMDAAVKEIDRAIKGLGLKGVQLFTPVRHNPLDLDEFMPVFEKMSEYDLPIWIHPDLPIERDDYKKFYLSHTFGWPYESTAAMTYLVLSGLFERFPRIKVIIHHCGALLPFFDQRIIECYDSSATIFDMDYSGRLSRHPVDYFKMFYTDTALSGGTVGLMCGHAFFGADHLLFGTDMPYDSEFGDRMIRETVQSVERMSISDAEKQMIYEDNARKLLGLAKTSKGG
jgi:predicted TIM-barrel fold metal-dependent hydrolase